MIVLHEEALFLWLCLQVSSSKTRLTVSDRLRQTTRHSTGHYSTVPSHPPSHPPQEGVSAADFWRAQCDLRDGQRLCGAEIGWPGRSWALRPLRWPGSLRRRRRSRRVSEVIQKGQTTVWSAEGNQHSDRSLRWMLWVV